MRRKKEPDSATVTESGKNKTITKKNSIPENEDCQDKIVMQGINSKGFGIIPKLVMQDRRLSIQAKAIYAYLCSYAGNGETAFPSRNKILFDLCINKDTYQKYLKQLKDYGYIKVQKVRKDGRFIRNLFILMQIIEPCPEIPCPKISDTVISDTVFSDNNNNNNINKNIDNNNQSFNQEKKGEKEGKKEGKKEKYTLEEIKEHYDYNILINDYLDIKKDIDSIMNILYDVLNSSNKTIKVMGEQKSVMVVQSKLLKLNYEHILYSIKKFDSVTQKIKNPSAYMLSILYQAEEQMNLDFKNQINYTMYT